MPLTPSGLGVSCNTKGLQITDRMGAARDPRALSYEHYDARLGQSLGYSASLGGLAAPSSVSGNLWVMNVMTNKDTKRPHFVPVSYLRAWAGDGDRVAVRRRSEANVFTPISPILL